MAEGRPLLVPHNAIFELRCTARLFEQQLGMPLEEAYFDVRSDTMVEAYIEAAHESYALKSLTWETFGHKMTEIMELFGDGADPEGSRTRFSFTCSTRPARKVIDYMCEDALWALAHHLKRYPQVTDPAFRGAFLYKVDMAMLPVICAMSDVGIAYDWNRMREAAQRGQAFMGRLATEINADLAAALGRPVALNLASPAQLAEGASTTRLRAWACRPGASPKRPASRPPTSMALKQLAAEHPVAKKVQDLPGGQAAVHGQLRREVREGLRLRAGRPGAPEHPAVRGDHRPAGVLPPGRAAAAQDGDLDAGLRGDVHLPLARFHHRPAARRARR